MAHPDLKQLTEMPAMSAPEEDLVAQARKAVNSEPAEDAEEKKKADPRTQEKWVFDFSWIDGNNKTWTGKFTNQVLTIRDQQIVGLLQTQMSGGAPYHSIDPHTKDINLAVAHMATSLATEDRPDWAKDLRGILNPDLLFALYKEVANHEATFHGRPTIEDLS